MKKNNLTRTLFVCSLIIITSFAIVMNVQAYPSTPNWGCHSKGNYTISARVSSIECDPGGKYGLEIIATGTGVVVDVYSGALDNDVFTISPGNIIADGDAADTNPTTGAITVILEITMPSSDGRYTLRILSRQTTLEGEDTDMMYLDLEVTVGNVIEPPSPSTTTLSGILIPILVIISAIILMSIVGVTVKKDQGKTEKKNAQPKMRAPPPQSYSRSTPSQYRSTQPRRRAALLQKHQSSYSRPSPQNQTRPNMRPLPPSQNYRRSTPSSYRNTQPRRRTMHPQQPQSYRTRPPPQNPRGISKAKSISSIDEESCTGCGFCLSRCKFNAITVNGVANVNPETCMGCGVCGVSCPSNAISMKRL